MIQPKIEQSWLEVLQEEFQKPYFTALKEFLILERQNYTVFPAGNKMFEAFNRTPFDKVKVVLLGQDPYHNVGQAEGLCFSVPDGLRMPPSLENIFKELNNDLGVAFPRSGHLGKWADEGVLLLNATLSVRAHQAGSHQNHGWETFTDEVIRQLSLRKTGLVFILWGSYAISKKKIITAVGQGRHYVLESVHPSPLSAYRGFFGCKHFSKTNELLQQQGLTPIDWNL